MQLVALQAEWIAETAWINRSSILRQAIWHRGPGLWLDVLA